jgi:hypothetical protein
LLLIKFVFVYQWLGQKAQFQYLPISILVGKDAGIFLALPKLCIPLLLLLSLVSLWAFWFILFVYFLFLCFPVLHCLEFNDRNDHEKVLSFLCYYFWTYSSEFEAQIQRRKVYLTHEQIFIQLSFSHGNVLYTPLSPTCTHSS